MIKWQARKIIIINGYKWGNIAFVKARENNVIHTETRDSLMSFRLSKEMGKHCKI